MTKLINKTILLVLQILALSGCGKLNLPASPPVELEVSPVAKPSSFEQALQYIRSQSIDERLLGMWAVLDYPDEIQEALPIIIQNLNYQQSSEVRSAAARVLGELGPLAKTAVPNLIDVMQTDSVADVRIDVAIALGKIEDTAAVPALAENLNLDKEYDLAAFSAKSIAQITGQSFPDSNSNGFRVDEQGVPLIVIGAREWWKDKGQFENWSEK